MFVDITLLNMFLDLILWDKLDVFCWSFALFIVDLLFLEFHFAPIISFWSYLILMYKKFIWFKNLLFLKSVSKSKHFSFLVFDFNVSYKIFPIPTWKLNCQEFSTLLVYTKTTVYYVLKNFSPPPPPLPDLLISTPPSIRYWRVNTFYQYMVTDLSVK